MIRRYVVDRDGFRGYQLFPDGRTVIVMDPEFKAWFCREVLVHEAALANFLRRSWLSATDVDDLCHDAYIKIIEAAERRRPTSPKAFLFSTARNLLVDRARRNQVIPIDLIQDMDSLNVLIDEVSPERSVSSLQYLLRLAKAFERLPDRCRDVVWMRKVENRSQKDIAAALGLAEATVESYLVRGIRLLTQMCYRGEVDGESDPGKRGKKNRENRHGQ